MAGTLKVLKVLVSFYRPGEEQAFERHRSRVSFDQEKHWNINSIGKHLKDFLGLSDLTKKFGTPDYEIKMFRLSRCSGKSGKVENYSIVTATVGNGNAFADPNDINHGELNGKSSCSIFCSLFKSFKTFKTIGGAFSVYEGL
jgi:hypothetical protein